MIQWTVWLINIAPRTTHSITIVAISWSRTQLVQLFEASRISTHMRKFYQEAQLRDNHHLFCHKSTAGSLQEIIIWARCWQLKEVSLMLVCSCTEPWTSVRKCVEWIRAQVWIQEWISTLQFNWHENEIIIWLQETT